MSKDAFSHLRYWVEVTATAAGAVAVWCLLVALIPAGEGGMRILGEMRNQQSRIAASFDGPKLCLVGASGTQLGIHAATIERETGVHTVNLGMSGQLNLGYMLERSKRDLRTGDTVLLAPEYMLLNGPRPVSLDEEKFLFAHDRAYFRTLPVADRLALALRLSWRDLAAGVGARAGMRRVFGKRGGPVGVRGDVGYDHEPTAEEVAGLLKAEPFDKQGPNERELGALRAYAAWCRRHGVQLLVSYPAYSRLWDLQTAEDKAFIAKLVEAYDGLGVPVLGRPEDFIYDVSWFYDTRNHLKPDKAEVSTLQRVKLLMPYLKQLRAPSAR